MTCSTRNCSLKDLPVYAQSPCLAVLRSLTVQCWPICVWPPCLCCLSICLVYVFVCVINLCISLLYLFVWQPCLPTCMPVGLDVCLFVYNYCVYICMFTFISALKPVRPAYLYVSLPVCLAHWPTNPSACPASLNKVLCLITPTDWEWHINQSGRIMVTPFLISAVVIYTSHSTPRLFLNERSVGEMLTVAHTFPLPVCMYPGSYFLASSFHDSLFLLLLLESSLLFLNSLSNLLSTYSIFFIYIFFPIAFSYFVFPSLENPQLSSFFSVLSLTYID